MDLDEGEAGGRTGRDEERETISICYERKKNLLLIKGKFRNHNHKATRQRINC